MQNNRSSFPLHILLDTKCLNEPTIEFTWYEQYAQTYDISISFLDALQHCWDRDTKLLHGSSFHWSLNGKLWFSGSTRTRNKTWWLGSWSNALLRRRRRLRLDSQVADSLSGLSLFSLIASAENKKKRENIEMLSSAKRRKSIQIASLRFNQSDKLAFKR